MDEMMRIPRSALPPTKAEIARRKQGERIELGVSMLRALPGGEIRGAIQPSTIEKQFGVDHSTALDIFLANQLKPGSKPPRPAGRSLNVAASVAASAG